MKQSRIEQIVLAYFPEDEFDDKARRYARLVAENVEREARQKIVSSIYELANSVAASSRRSEG